MSKGPTPSFSSSAAMSQTQASYTTYGGSDLGRTPRKSGGGPRVNYYDASESDKDYELPKIVQSSRESWMEVAKALAIVCALLAGVETQFLQIMGSVPDNSARLPKYRAIRALSYISLLLNISAVVGTFFMLDILTELPFRVYKYGHNQEGERPTKHSISAMLKEFGADRRWTVAKGFTQLCSIIGMLTAVIQIIMWVWMTEGREVSIVVTLVGMAGVFLAGYWFMASLGRSKKILNEP